MERLLTSLLTCKQEVDTIALDHRRCFIVYAEQEGRAGDVEVVARQFVDPGTMGALHRAS